MNLVLFWTDGLVWGLVATLIIWLSLSAPTQQGREQFKRLFASPLAMVSFVILCVYIMIALLDSIHFNAQITHILAEKAQKQPGLVSEAAQFKVKSVLDWLLSGLSTSTERTYSAPFALFEYTKSMRVSADGSVSYNALPLRHVQAGYSILYQTLTALAFALLITAVMLFLHVKTLSLKLKCSIASVYNAIWTGQFKMAWKTAYVTFFILIMLIIWVSLMSQFIHVLGTDKVGEDVLYSALKSIRTGVLIGVLTTLVMLPLSIILGISAGFLKGWVDDLIQYLYTTLNSIPGVLLIAAAVLVMQVMMSNHADWFGSTEERADVRLLFLIFILGMTSWTGLCRLLRAETLKVSQIEFVIAAQAFGVSRFQIIKQHIMPNLMHLILIAIVLDFSGLVLAEAVLSYVGVGVDPTMYSWGNMINQARLEMAQEPMVWWSLFSAFIFMFILVLAANLLADRIQTVLNPKS